MLKQIIQKLEEILMSLRYNGTKFKKSITFLEALTLIFIYLKLCNTIDWSWWAILCPIYVPYGIGVVKIVFHKTIMKILK